MPVAVKINDDIATAARAEAELMNRSTTEQLEYWTRIGRALERLPDVSMAKVRAVLDAGRDFDDLNADERAIALGALETLTFNPKGDRALQREKAAAGHVYTALDNAGRVVEVRPGGRRRVIADVDAYAELPDSAA
jgi:hypothetical protein